MSRCSGVLTVGSSACVLYFADANASLGETINLQAGPDPSAAIAEALCDMWKVCTFMFLFSGTRLPSASKTPRGICACMCRVRLVSSEKLVPKSWFIFVPCTLNVFAPCALMQKQEFIDLYLEVGGKSDFGREKRNIGMHRIVAALISDKLKNKVEAGMPSFGSSTGLGFCWSSSFLQRRACLRTVIGRQRRKAWR